MFCSKCGNQVDQNVGFCPKCGNPMNNNVNNVAASNTNNQMYNNPVNPTVNNVVNNNVNGQVNTNYNTNMNVNNGAMPVNNVNGFVNNGVTNTVNYPVNNMNYNQNYNNSNSVNNKPNKSNKPIIFVLGGIVVLLIIIVAVLLFAKKNNADDGGNDGVLDSRTIMIYMCGSDLESRIALASSDLESIKASEVDENINVVVYTGGAKRWYNYVSNQENAIYVLEDSGFVKKETYNKASMGESSSLSTLLDYSYDNYKADKYDLVMWNHGLGALGISSDELFGSDFLSLNELTESLSKSKFTGDNKFIALTE